MSRDPSRNPPASVVGRFKLSHIIIAASLLLDLYLANSIYEDLSGFFAQRESTQQYVSNNATNAR